MKKLVAITMALSMLLGAGPTQAAALNDIYGSWAQQDIHRLSSQKIVEGTGGQFSPDRPVSRVQFAKMLVSAMGLADEARVATRANSGFKDVPTTYWGNGYIIVAKEQGIINGFEDGTFKPEQLIRRDEIAVMMMRALGTSGDSSTVPQLSFADKELIPRWAADSIFEAVKQEFINGYPDNTFRPTKSTTRAEATVLINRYLAKLGQAYDFYGEIMQVDERLKTILINIDGQNYTFVFNADTIIYNGEVLRGSNILRTEQKILFNVNQFGIITLVKTTEKQNDEGASIAHFSSALKQSVGYNGSANNVIKLKSSKLLAEGSTNYQEVSPELSLEVTKNEMGVQRFTKDYGSNGSGQIIAIIDTGVDPGHPDLLFLPDGAQKIIDWVDFTEEGKISTLNRATAYNGSIVLEDEYRIGRIKSKSGIFRIGFLQEESLKTEGGNGFDINLNGSEDQYAVLLVDSSESGQYDTVYVDTNSDKSFTNEQPLQSFKSQHQFAYIPSANGKEKFDFVIADISTKGEYVQLGFDSNGHGTHVSGIAAANGQIQGVAPGAKIMAIKAINGAGVADWDDIIRAVEYAAKNGAKVINLSLGYPGNDPRGTSYESQAIEAISKKYGVHVVVAAGNSGPGLSTINVPANSQSVISVGAFISPAMWKQDYGYEVKEDSLWYFSSMGPRKDGAQVPMVVAPGSAVSTVTFRGYNLLEGTSMAAPHVTGAVALLAQEAAKNKITVTPETMRRAIAIGARVIPHLSDVEQGYGEVNVPNAWAALKNLKPGTEFSVQVFNQKLNNGPGLYAKGFEPGQLSYKVFNLGQGNQKLQLSTTAPWLLPSQKELNIPMAGARRFDVSFQNPQEPGLYTGRIKADNPNTPGIDLEIFNTIINPIYIGKLRQNTFENKAKLTAGQFKRYYIDVPKGTGKIDINLAINPDGQGKLLGRARLHVFTPDGDEYKQDLVDFAGISPDGKNKPLVTKAISKPQPGIWEVVVYSSATLSEYGLGDSQYNLTVNAGELETLSQDSNSSNLLLGILPRPLEVGKKNYLTLQVRYRLDKRPYQGVVEINGKVYSVNNGRVVFAIVPESSNPAIEVKTLN